MRSRKLISVLMIGIILLTSGCLSGVSDSGSSQSEITNTQVLDSSCATDRNQTAEIEYVESNVTVNGNIIVSDGAKTISTSIRENDGTAVVTVKEKNVKDVVGVQCLTNISYSVTADVSDSVDSVRVVYQQGGHNMTVAEKPR